MFAYCDKRCGYDSGDVKNMKELEEKVNEDGGCLGGGDTNSICPICKNINTLWID